MMTSRSGALYERARSVLPGGTTRSTVFVTPSPPYAATGEGIFIEDEDGRRIIDCNNNYTSLIHGHAHPDIIATARRVFEHGTAFGLPTRLEVSMAETLQERTGVERWRFCNSGTEAVMMLVRTARAATGRDLIVRFDGSYHGTYDGVTQIGAIGVPESTERNSLVLPQNDVTALERAFAEHGDRIAAVLIDLMPNRAGLRPAERSLVTRIRELTAQHGALLAIDEVISFRLGYGGLHHAYGVTPDLISLGKVVGGGFPVGAVGGRPEIMGVFDPRAKDGIVWGGTFSANPVSMAAGMEALRLYDADVLGGLSARGDRLREDLATAGVDVTGSGSLMQIHTADKQALWWSLYRNGVLIGSNGLIALSTPMTDEVVDEIRDRVIDAVLEGAR